MTDDHLPSTGPAMPPKAPVEGAFSRVFPCCDEVGLVRLAELLALKLKAGDVVALVGDLGAGKTTLARALIRALIGNPDAEVPSPTFPLVQDYATPRLTVRHYDFYRLGGPDDVAELGFDEAIRDGAALVEWPERAWSALGPDRIEIAIEASDAGNSCRRVALTGRGTAAPRVARILELVDFLADAPLTEAWAGATIAYLQGDASPRGYARLVARGGRSAILMDAPRAPDGPPVRDGLPYSRIAHLAEDVGPFVAIARHLAAADLSVPAILASDLDAGLLLIEDLGDLTFARALAEGESQHVLWQAALGPLAHLHGASLPAGLATYDARALTIECELVVDWMWTAVTGEPTPASVRAAYASAWRPLIARVADRPENIVLRDYHSPNLMWLPDREGRRRVGILDFQDAVAGPAAYDVVSLLQDARLDVAADLERGLLDEHVATLGAAGRITDPQAFRADYAILGAQRASKILGIFVRLSRRDGKHGYLAHLPRISDYLERNLAHPALAEVRHWYDTHLPPARRQALAKPASRGGPA